eukprot:TRINITY_DN4731_c0_g1_i7.p1 TRINITY_DN4731_c0_g1~~TRINITY_DN4731_c0_g1_i7.p1  ORF type:complete len:150 (+),score=16.65 TRINITY_DN4731_c0_g1_i7:70-519(+)
MELCYFSEPPEHPIQVFHKWGSIECGNKPKTMSNTQIPLSATYFLQMAEGKTIPLHPAMLTSQLTEFSLSWIRQQLQGTPVLADAELAAKNGVLVVVSFSFSKVTEQKDHHIWIFSKSQSALVKRIQSKRKITLLSQKNVNDIILLFPS